MWRARSARRKLMGSISHPLAPKTRQPKPTPKEYFASSSFDPSFDDPEAVLRAVPTDITADGLMIVGLAKGAIGQQLTSTGFIWTTATDAWC